LIVPVVIKEAQMEQANYILQNSLLGGPSEREQMQREGVTSFSVPGLQESFGKVRPQRSRISPDALVRISKWIKREKRVGRG
jgi:hypothetical protein